MVHADTGQTSSSRLTRCTRGTAQMRPSMTPLGSPTGSTPWHVSLFYFTLRFVADPQQKSQFNGMPKIFESSETKGWKLLDNPEVVSVLITGNLVVLMRHAEAALGAVLAVAGLPLQARRRVQARQLAHHPARRPQHQSHQEVSLLCFVHDPR